MSGVQANWFSDILVEDEEDLDPFEADERGLPIEIGDEEARVSRSLRDSMEKEGVLAGRGVTCEIKDRPDTTCWACPVFKSDPAHSMSALCRVGREQDRLVTRMAQLQIARREAERHDQNSLHDATD